MSERPKLGFEMWGIRFNAEGALAIVGAIVLVGLVLAFSRFRKSHSGEEKLSFKTPMKL
jgi:hypothetical protein